LSECFVCLLYDDTEQNDTGRPVGDYVCTGEATIR